MTARLISRNRREPTLPQLQSGRVTAAELGFPVHSLAAQCKVLAVSLGVQVFGCSSAPVGGFVDFPIRLSSTLRGIQARAIFATGDQSACNHRPDHSCLVAPGL